MKQSNISRTLSAFAMILALTFVTSKSALAASDYFLKIEGVGYSKTVKVDGPNASFSFGDLPEGDYTLTIVDGTGRSVAVGGNVEYQVAGPRDAASGQATGRRDAASGQATGRRDAASGQATGRRDAASGMATGRRQYQPILVRKTLSSSSPLRAKISVDGGGSVSGHVSINGGTN